MYRQISRRALSSLGPCRPPRVLQSWTSPCRGQTQWLSTTRRLSAENPYYITTPIFYVNADPHIGHLYTLILADVLKRWQILQGNSSLLCTGTDEHGMKIQQAAAKAKMEPRAFCDQNYINFRDLADAANINYDHFVRTSEPEHRFAVQHFWLMLKERGYIYPSKHEGWYSVSDETFYPASGVHLALDPRTGRKFMASVETGKEVEWTSEENYHFRLSQFREPLLEYYKMNPDFVVPSTRMAAVVKDVEDGLQDLSISRPIERLTWGIPVPDDESQTIYVWLDALINYLTKTNYPFQTPGQEKAAGWPADVQVIGKDIVRFHCIYWPAFLMALNISPPRQILTHAHWTLGRQKMSKSLGNVVNPFFALDRFDVDVMRFYMIHDGGLKDDAAYDNSYIVKRWQKALGGGIGNLTARVTRSTLWDVGNAVSAVAKNKNASLGTEAESELKVLLKALPEAVAGDFAKLDPGAALKQIMATVYRTNAFIQTAAPWQLYRAGRAPEGDLVIYLCAEALRVCGILLQPYMPDSMSRLLDMLGVASDKRSFEHAVLGADFDFGVADTSAKDLRGEVSLLFPGLKCYG